MIFFFLVHFGNCFILAFYLSWNLLELFESLVGGSIFEKITCLHEKLGHYQSKITFLKLPVVVFLFIQAEFRMIGPTNSEQYGFSLSCANRYYGTKVKNSNEGSYLVMDSQGSCFPHCIQHLVLSQAIFFAVLVGCGSGSQKAEVHFSFTLIMRIQHSGQGILIALTSKVDLGSCFLCSEPLNTSVN